MHLCIRIKAITLVTKGLYNKQKTPGEVWPLYLYGFLTHCQLSISTESDNLLPAVKRSVKLVRRFKIRVQNKTTVHTQVRTHVHTHTHLAILHLSESPSIQPCVKTALSCPTLLQEYSHYGTEWHGLHPMTHMHTHACARTHISVLCSFRLMTYLYFPLTHTCSLTGSVILQAQVLYLRPGSFYIKGNFTALISVVHAGSLGQVMSCQTLYPVSIELDS